MNENIQKVHINQFAGNMKILMMHEPIEKDECFFRYENGMMKTIQGYYIYYEKNNLMQTYMIEHRSEKEEIVVEEKTDAATQHFRSLVQEKQEEIHKRKTMAFMYSVSSGLVMIVLVIGITMLNNYDKMSNMEKSLAILTKNSITEEVEQKQQAESQEIQLAEQVVQEDEPEEVPVNAGSGKLHTVAVETVSGNVEPVASEIPQQGETVQATNDAKAVANQQAAAENSTTSTVTQPSAVTEVPAVTDSPVVTEQPVATQAPVPTEPPAATEPPREEVQASAEPQYYIIEKGDTLAKISLKIYNTKDMVSKICEVNEIEDVDKIFVGQKILLP